jgi:hypothetical protein
MIDSSKIKRKRELFLRHLYKKSDGNITCIFLVETIGKDLGFNKDESINIALTLKEQGYIEVTSMGPYIKLTALGIEEVENAFIFNKIKIFLNNPWVITISGGVIVAFIIFLGKNWIAKLIKYFISYCN